MSSLNEKASSPIVVVTSDDGVAEEGGKDSSFKYIILLFMGLGLVFVGSLSISSASLGIYSQRTQDINNNARESLVKADERLLREQENRQKLTEAQLRILQDGQLKSINVNGTNLTFTGNPDQAVLQKAFEMDSKSQHYENERAKNMNKMAKKSIKKQSKTVGKIFEAGNEAIRNSQSIFNKASASSAHTAMGTHQSLSQLNASLIDLVRNPNPSLV